MASRVRLCGLAWRQRCPFSVTVLPLVDVPLPGLPFHSVTHVRQRDLCLENRRLSSAAERFLFPNLDMALVKTWFACIDSIARELRRTLMVHTKYHTYGLNDTLEPPQSVTIQCLLSLDWSHITGNIMVIRNSGSGATTKPRSHFSADGSFGTYQTMRAWFLYRCGKSPFMSSYDLCTESGI